jgi:hypothetical protein
MLMDTFRGVSRAIVGLMLEWNREILSLFERSEVLATVHSLVAAGIVRHSGLIWQISTCLYHGVQADCWDALRKLRRVMRANPLNLPCTRKASWNPANSVPPSEI